MQITKTAAQREEKEKSVEFHGKKIKKVENMNEVNGKLLKSARTDDAVYEGVCVVPQIDYILVHDPKRDSEGWG